MQNIGSVAGSMRGLYYGQKRYTWIIAVRCGRISGWINQASFFLHIISFLKIQGDTMPHNQTASDVLSESYCNVDCLDQVETSRSNVVG